MECLAKSAYRTKSTHRADAKPLDEDITKEKDNSRIMGWLVDAGNICSNNQTTFRLRPSNRNNCCIILLAMATKASDKVERI